MNILVVENNGAMRAVVAGLLSRAGHTVRGCSNSGEAWMYFRDGEKFDCVLSGQCLPRVDGIELLRRLRGSEKAPDILRFILMSSDLVVKQECRRHYAEFLRMPFSVEGLLNLF